MTKAYQIEANYNLDSLNQVLEIGDVVIDRDFTFKYVIGFTVNGPIIAQEKWFGGTVSVAYLTDHTRRIKIPIDYVNEVKPDFIPKIQNALPDILEKFKRSKAKIVKLASL